MKIEEIVEGCAKAAHAANRVWCQCNGDDSQPDWQNAPAWQQDSARKGVIGAINGNTPRQSHESWLAEKEATGWKYGPVKDPEKKEHPCFVPYDELPPIQKVKDEIFITTVRMFYTALSSL